MMDSSGRLHARKLEALAGTTLEFRAQICASASSDAPVDLLVFDGDPSDGNLIAGKRFYVPNENRCEGTWFNWSPSGGQHKLVAAMLPKNPPLTPPANPLPLTKASLAVEVLPYTVTGGHGLK